MQTSLSGGAAPSPPSLARAVRAIAKAKAVEPLEFEQTVLRVIIGALITFYLIYAYAFDGLYQRSGAIPGLYMAASWVSAGWILFHLCNWRTSYVPRRAWSVINDASTVSVIIGMGHETAVTIFPVYLFVILGNGFRFGIPYMYAAIVANVVCFSVMVSLSPIWQANWRFAIGLGLEMIVVPLYAAKLIRSLRQAKEEAEEASRAKTDFLSMMSHELRTPLTAIIGLSNVSKATAATAKERFSAISTELAAGRLLRMLDTILKFQRIESGKVERRDRAFNMLDLMNELRAIVEPLAEQKGLEFHICFTSGLPRLLRSDPDHVETVVVNLVTNAVKYTQQGRVTLEVGLVRQGGEPVMRVAVRDTGIGIPEEAQARIFDRFVRAQDHNVSTESGVGLGLATSKSLIEMLGGRLEFESAYGVGSHFWADIPVGVEDGGMLPRPDAKAHAEIVAVAGVATKAAEKAGAAAMTESELLTALSGDPARIARAVLIIDRGRLSAPLREALTEAAARKESRPALILTGAGGEADDALGAAAAASPQAEDQEALAGLIGTVARWHARLSADYVSDGPEVAPLIRRLSILVADDNALNRQVISRMFMIDGHDVILAQTGDEALQVLLEGKVECAFLDVNMPGLSGIEVAQSYKTGLGSAATIPLIGLTADISQETRQDCLVGGMVEVLGKPVTLDQLRDTLDRFALSSATPSAEPAILAHGPNADEERIASLRELFGEAGFHSHFLASFERDLFASLEKTEAAVQADNPQAIRDALHSIKSSASTAGAIRILGEVAQFQNSPSGPEFPAFESRVRTAFADYREAVLAMPPAESDAGEPARLRTSSSNRR